jgi:hypothetical protein
LLFCLRSESGSEENLRFIGDSCSLLLAFSQVQGSADFLGLGASNFHGCQRVREDAHACQFRKQSYAILERSDHRDR